MRDRSPLWWKSGLFLLSILTAGIVLIMGISGPILYGQSQTLTELTKRVENMDKYIDQHEELLDPNYQPPLPPTEDELVQLLEQMPTEEELPRFLLQLREAASMAGVHLTKVRFADTPEELDRLIREEIKEQKKEGNSVFSKFQRDEDLYYLPSVPQISMIWLDVFIEADQEQMKYFIMELGQLTRTVHVQEWELYLKGMEGTQKKGNARVRLSIFMYHDPRLTNLPPLPELKLDKGSGETIHVSPEEQGEPKKKKDDKKKNDFPLPSDSNEPYWWFPYPADKDLPEPLPGTEKGPFPDR